MKDNMSKTINLETITNIFEREVQRGLKIPKALFGKGNRLECQKSGLCPHHNRCSFGDPPHCRRGTTC